jgi:hypothetical protein
MTDDAWLLLSGMVLTAISGLPGLLFGRRSLTGQWFATTLAVVGCLGGLVAAWRLISAPLTPVLKLPSPIAQAPFVLAADSLSAFFLVPIFLISLLGSVYGHGAYLGPDFTADYLLLPFTQVRVNGVNASTRTVNFEKSGKYPLPSFFNSLPTPPAGYVDDGYYVFAFRNGQPLRGTGRMVVVGPLNDNSVQITDTSPWAQSSQISSIQTGDTLVIIWRSGLGTIFTSGCTGLTLQNISIYASGFIGLLANTASSTTIDHVQVIPRPGTDRLISTNADGIHLGRSGPNNVVSNNTVRRGCDVQVEVGRRESQLNDLEPARRHMLERLRERARIEIAEVGAADRQRCTRVPSSSWLRAGLVTPRANGYYA